MYTLIFGRLAGISTDGLPPILFYLAGISCWNYFADCLQKTSSTFIDNQEIYSKVYFPRLVIPISVVISNLLKFLVQFVLFIGFLCYFFIQGTPIHPNQYLLLLPILIFILALLGLSFGLIVTSLTSKYRDFVYLIQFGVQLFMFATPIIYPLSKIPIEYQKWSLLNPLTSVIEAFKYGFLGQGFFSWQYLLYSLCFSLLLFFLGLHLFNKTEKSFIDTI